MIMLTARCTLLASAAILLLSPPCFAAASARLHVSATVPPYVSFNATKRTATYEVRKEDIQRGYVDLPASVTMTMKSNLRGGVPVLVDNGGDGEVLIKESGRGNYGGASFTVNTAGYAPYSVITKTFDSRVVLPSDAREGVYPFMISLMPAI